MATYLSPDSTELINGVTVNEYLLTKHNPNRIDMPSATMDGNVIGVTIHNTDWIIVSSATTPAEQYTRATVNGNMNDVRVHYYVDNRCAWQNLPLSLSGWHAADGRGNGNRRTVAIECIMSSAYNDADKKSEDNCARLAAYLLQKFGLTIDDLYTHSYWMNVRDGKTGTREELNVMHNAYKNCPAYILPHWTEFKEKVKSYLTTDNPEKELYRVRKSWDNVASQTGAYSILSNAVSACAKGYTVFDSKGIPVYTNTGTAYTPCPYAEPVRVVKIGSTGEDVRWVQWCLIEKGYYCGSSGVDGDFGKATDRALRAFQEVANLEVDGACGAITRSVLKQGIPDSPAPAFTPRLTRPTSGNKFYICQPDGYSRAIKGKPTDSQCNVLANCVGYAFGRFHEIANRTQMDYFDPVNAENIFANAKAHGMKTGDTPKLGALIVWQKGATLSGSDGAGHVAVVEQINEDGSIVISQSGWNASSPFWTQVLKKPYSYGSAYKLLGFVYNPSV